MDYNQIKKIYNGFDDFLVGVAMLSFHQNLIFARKKNATRVNGQNRPKFNSTCISG